MDSKLAETASPNFTPSSIQDQTREVQVEIQGLKRQNVQTEREGIREEMECAGAEREGIRDCRT